MRTLAIIMAATFLASPAFAADEFGSRFGNNTPYALENGVNAAVADTDGFDMDDLNDISPAAGHETGEEGEAHEDGEAMHEEEAHGDHGDMDAEHEDTEHEEEAHEGHEHGEGEGEGEAEAEADMEHHEEDHSAE